MLKIEDGKWGAAFKPLEKVKVTDAPKGTLVARDGLNREYARLRGGRSVSFIAAGALGTHTLTLEDKAGKILDSAVDPDSGKSLRSFNLEVLQSLDAGKGFLLDNYRGLIFYVDLIFHIKHKTKQGIQNKSLTHPDASSKT